MTSVEMKSSITTRDKILQYLLVNRSAIDEGCTIKDIAIALGISTNATRQYLVVLEKEDLVVRTEKKGVTGRPAMMYTLHENALEAFPKVYADFSVTLIDELRNKFGEKETIEVLKKVGKTIAADIFKEMQDSLAKGETLDTLDKRLKSTTKILQKYGKYPELIEDETSYSFKNYNCLVYGVVKANPLVCKVDETIMTELAGKKAVKEKCIRDGDAFCLYRIMKDQKEKSTD